MVTWHSVQLASCASEITLSSRPFSNETPSIHLSLSEKDFRFFWSSFSPRLDSKTWRFYPKSPYFGSWFIRKRLLTRFLRSYKVPKTRRRLFVILEIGREIFFFFVNSSGFTFWKMWYSLKNQLPHSSPALNTHRVCNTSDPCFYAAKDERVDGWTGVALRRGEKRRP